MPESIGFIIAGQTHSISVPDGATAQLVDAFCDTYNYPATVIDENGDEIDNPISRERFVTVKIREFSQDIIKGWAKKAARATAEQQAEAAVDALFSQIEYT